MKHRTDRISELAGYALLAALTACGGESPEPSTFDPAAILEYPDEAQALQEGLPPMEYFMDQQDNELGRAEQALGGKTSTTFQYGTRTATNGRACDKVTTGQQCVVPQGTGLTGSVGAKVITWRLTPVHGFSAAEQTAITNAVTALDNTLSAWTFSFTTGASGAIQLGNAAASGSSGSSAIDAFVETTFANQQNLTEQAGVVGTYLSSVSCLVKLDIADINTRGAAEEALTPGSTGEVGKLRTHAILVGLQRCIGLGTRDDAGSAGNYIDRTLVFPGPMFRPLQSAGDQCRANSYDHLTSIAQYANLSPACAD